MRTVSLLTLLYLSLILSESEAFGKRRAQKTRSHESTNNTHVFYNPLPDANAICIDPHCNCGNTGFGIVQKIPYLPWSTFDAPIDIQFSSACVKCGLCLTVAFKLNETLTEIHNRLPLGTWLNDTEATTHFQEICADSFKHHSLREVNGKRYIIERIPRSTLVSSTADGLWEINLRDKCRQFLKNMDPVRLYRHWQERYFFDESYPDIQDILCRNDDIFRDCKNIEDTPERHHRPDIDFRANLKMRVEFKCK
ncbi:uncharacterized protein LOC112493974 [Cephus cinctus]|uniref:Uncharacterized protein LOC112493974 n=1 Tax=Cephus cinctus TaxID=211228 RepID=A0AAJ7RC80_CEPCN|nr:uncharacterized protein LOC112493974 [Cephus cinctus]